MTGFLEQLRVSLALHFRNRMALFYGYLFPTIFLVAFWVLYRHERVPIVRHLGELLTIGVLGGACFGLPTTLVSERERGVWRRYRLAPLPTWSLVASTVAARYVLLVTAGLLQIALAMAIGMPAPVHPFGLAVAFTCVALGFLGMGLVIAMMADNVPAVQALGQCIFLPMLIIGGVAVPLSSLPVWAQHVSAFFPGRYAVDALQAAATGGGLDAATFSLFALLVIGAAGLIAGARLFRWDAGERFAARAGKGWVAVALAGWAAVGLAAETRGAVKIVQEASVAPPAMAPPPAIAPEVAPAPLTAKPATRMASADTAVAPAPVVKAPAPPSARTVTDRPSWQSVTLAQIEKNIDFTKLPPDDGIVTPIAPADEDPEPDLVAELDRIRQRLPSWKPGQVADPVQRVRNYLFVIVVPDLFQIPIERFVPHLVFEHLQTTVPKNDLVKILYWIALHPEEGDDAALDDLHAVGLGNGPKDTDEVGTRTGIYAVKLLGRLVGKIQAG
jgi:ABC-2 type transport system permease protein